MLGSGNSIKWLNGLVFCLLAGGLLLAWLSIPQQPVKLAAVELEPLVGDGRPVELADLRGKVVLLNFWGTWCAPCRAEFPQLVELSRNWQGSPRFQALLVSCSPGAENMPELRQQTADFLKAHPVHLTIYADARYRTRAAVSDAIGFRGYPTTLVLDGDGQIRGKWVGYSPGTEVEIDNLIRELLHSPSEPAAGHVAAAQ